MDHAGKKVSVEEKRSRNERRRRIRKELEEPLVERDLCHKQIFGQQITRKPCPLSLKKEVSSRVLDHFQLSPGGVLGYNGPHTALFFSKRRCPAECWTISSVPGWSFRIQLTPTLVKSPPFPRRGPLGHAIDRCISLADKG